MSCFYILEINPLSVVSFAIILSHSEVCLFTLFIVFFAVQSLLSLIRHHLFIFVFISIICFDFLYEVGNKGSCYDLCHTMFCLCFLLSFIVFCLTFRSLIHFEFIFECGIRKCSNSILLHVVVQFFQLLVIEETLSSHYIFLPTLSKIRSPEGVWIDLGFLSCSTGLYFCSCASTILS